jgi:hypothetical protein
MELLVPTAKKEPEDENLHVLIALLSEMAASLLIFFGLSRSPVKL